MRCMLRFTHTPLNVTTNHYHPCLCGDLDIELHLFFHCSARAALLSVCNVFGKCGFGERFEHLAHAALLRLF